MPSLLPRLAAMTAVVTMLAASHATAQKQPAAKAAETARLAGVGVQLFLEDSGRLSPDVTEIADFRGFNMQANGTGIALERFTDFLISVRFEAPGETFAKGRQATVAIIDAKSGVSGAGREAKEANLFAEVSEGTHAYSVAAHRHAPEIEQGLTRAAGKPILVNFTAHLMPMNRGIQESIYVKLAPGASADDLRDALAKRYAGEPFVRVVPKGVSPHTRHVRGSNFVLIGVFADRLPGRAILLSVEDNLVKGASGQAVQNMNVMMGLPETTGLEQQPLFP